MQLKHYKKDIDKPKDQKNREDTLIVSTSSLTPCPEPPYGMKYTKVI